MSSLRVGLKKSLEETGPMGLHDKAKRKYSVSCRDPDRKKKTSKQKSSSSNRNVSRRKKYLTPDLAERSIKKESTSQFMAELGKRSMSSVSDYSFPAQPTNEDGAINFPAALRADEESAASDDARSFSSHEPSSFSDSDTVTNASSCCSHRRQRHRIHSSGDEDSSNNSQSERDEMQEDMEGVFDMEGTSADESYERNPSTNLPLATPHFELQHQPCLPPQEDNVAHHHQQSPLKKKKKKKRDKGKRKKDRQKLNLTSLTSSIKGEEHESLEHAHEDELNNGQSYDGVDTHSKDNKASNQAFTALHDMGNEPRSLISRRPILKKKASSKKMTVIDPSPDVLEWVSGMSQGKQRRKIQVGVRVKVRFEFKSNKRGPDGKKRCFNWCGGCVTRVGPEGKEVRILYDDGTSEDTGFPDREIVVDDNGNGRHTVPVDAFLPKQPAILMTINEANQGVDLNNHGVAAESIENNSIERLPAHDILPKNEDFPETLPHIMTKPMKEEYLEETSDMRLHVDSPQGIKNFASKISHESSNSRSSKNNVPEPSFTNMQSESEVAIAGDTHNSPSSRSWDSHDTGRSFHQTGLESNPGQATAPVGAGVQPESSAQVSKKIKLKRRKIPMPDNNGNNENDFAHSALNSMPRPETCAPSLKIRLKTKSVKHKKLIDNTANTNSAQGEPNLTKIRIKCDPEGNNAADSWPSVIPTNSNVVRVHKSGNSISCALGDNAWLGDDEGQGLKRSQSELEEASESENDATMLSRVFAKAHTAGKQNITPNEIENTPTATSVADSCNTPVINFLFKGRKHPKEEMFDTEDASVKISTTSHSLSVTPPPAPEPSSEGMPKKKKQRTHNPTVQSHRSSGTRSPKNGKLARTEVQTCTIPSFPLPDSHIAIGKKSKKEKQASSEQNASHNDSVKLSINSKEHVKKLREYPMLGNGVEPDLGDRLPVLPQQSGIIGEDANSKYPIIRSGRKVSKIAKQKMLGKDEPGVRDASKTKRKSKGKNSVVHRSMKEIDREDNSENREWVQCENCDKWRCMVPNFDVESLPERWYCKDNPDKSRNTCKAPEQTPEEVAREKRMKNAADDNIFNRSELMSSLTVHNKRSLSHQRPIEKIVKDPTSSKPIAGNNGVTTDATNLDVIRSLTGSPQYDSAVTNKSISSDLFDGHTSEVQMTPDPISGGEIDGTGSDGTIVSALPVNKNIKGSNRKSRKGKGDEKDKKSSKGKKQKESISQEWVQCEKCEKWRRLPPRVKPKDLPDVWTCDMNDWDPRSASCAVQEDHKVDKAINPDKDIIGKDGLSSNVQTNKLSYRNLIRIPNRTISERTRAADSLFSSCATDPDKPPTVMYANSSAFQHKGGMHRSLEHDKETISLFTYMSNSELWKDLYHYTLQPTLSRSFEIFETVGNDTKIQGDKDNFQSAKAMVYYALSMQKLAIHDVLLECQCREWDDLQWIELRAMCTLESVQLALNALVKDGLVEVLPCSSNLAEADFGVVCYRRIQIGGNETGAARCMKISKPWKQTQMDTS